MISTRVLNRTLLARQHLLERVDLEPVSMAEHLVGMQAQVALPPYVGLWARLRDFAPDVLTDLIEGRELSRILMMRGTIHLVSRRDLIAVRPTMQEMLTRQSGSTEFFRSCADLPRADLEAAGREVLAAGPLSATELGQALAERFVGHAPGHLANTVRVLLPLVQAPPRGVWKKGGAPVYVPAEAWIGASLTDEPDFPDVVRRYLRAFGPATAADVATWCGRTGIAGDLAALGDEVVTDTDEQGRTLHDLAGLELADPDLPAPVRLLGVYDNVFLSHQDRARVMTEAYRSRWMGRNGVAGAAVVVDGMLEGVWRETNGRVEVDLYRRLTRDERADLDAEVARLEEFLAR